MDSEDMPNPEPSTSSVENTNSEAKVSDAIVTGPVHGILDTDTLEEPSSRETANSRDNDSAEEVIISHVASQNELACGPVGSETERTISGLGEVSLPPLRVSEKRKTNSITKSASVTSLKSLQSGNVDGPSRFKNFNNSRAVVDTAAPIESVRDAVSKFGGIADWKTQRVQTLEKRRHIGQEIEKIQEEMIDCKKRSKAAEDAEIEVLNELERAKKQIEELELQLSLCNSERKEQSHNRDIRLVKVDISDAAGKEEEELENVVAHQEASLAELIYVPNELQAARNSLSMNTVGEALDDMEIAINELTTELIETKESLHAAEIAYKEAEDQRSASVLAFEEDSHRWEREVKQVEEEVEKLNQEYLYAKDLKSKLDSASALLATLKMELGSYIGSRMKQEIADAKSKAETENSKTKVWSVKKELEQVKLRTEKATTEVSILKLATSSLQSELRKEKEAASAVKKRAGMTMVAIQSLEEELSRIESETALIEMRKKEAREKMVELPSKLQQASEEADHFKSLKQVAYEELQRVRDDAEQIKAEACTTETRLHAVEKEIEATKASEKLALSAIHGLQESEAALDMNDTDSDNVVIISVDEYEMLSMWAQEAEEQAKTRLAAALIQIEAAKKSESKSLQRLEEIGQELSVKKVYYGSAKKKSEKAMNEKLKAEQDLRSWRTKNEQRRKASMSSSSFASDSSNVKENKDTKKSGEVAATDPHRHTLSLRSSSGDQSRVEYDSSMELRVPKKKKKKSLLPGLLKFFGKRKPRASRKLT